MQAFSPATLLERDSNIGVFMWTLQNFLRAPLLRTPVNCCSNVFSHEQITQQAT